MRPIQMVDTKSQYLKIKPAVDEAIHAVLDSAAYINGKPVQEFAKSLGNYLQAAFTIPCANGTDALQIAMMALDLQPGDEVITPSFTYIATTEVVALLKLKPVFVEVDPKTFCIDPESVRKAITPRTKAIVPVHLYGQPADMDPILGIAQKRGLWVIEDCAQAHMAQYKGRTVGTMGTAASFSFYPGKNLGAMGDAGCIVTNDNKLAGWCELYARHGGKGEHTIEGINSRLDGLQAAILSAKLPHLAGWTAARQNIAKKYDDLLRDVVQVSLPTISPDRTHVFHLYVIRCGERDALQAHLNAAGISTMLNYPRALPFYPAYAYLGHKSEDFPNAFANQSRILSIPIYPEMTDEAIRYVAKSIGQFRH
jgi:dTDP-4-amino-4,6-dideoxygalactose transaminase